MSHGTAVVFGAGKMACGLLGYLLDRSGYRVCFVARRPEVVDALNRHGGYRLFVTGGARKDITIRGCAALLLGESERVAEAVADAAVVMTGIGVANLVAIAPVIAAGLWRRSQTWGAAPLNIVACENLPGAGGFLRHEIVSAATYDQALAVDAVGGFGAALTRRIMVGGNPADDELRFKLSGEPDLIVDSNGLRPPLPLLTGACFTDEFDSLVMRKLFTLNCAQAVAAYLGARAGYTYLHEPAADPFIGQIVRGALTEARVALQHEFPHQARDIACDAAKAFTELADPAMRDPIVRVARDPLRKLSSVERLIGPARLALRHRLPYKRICLGVAAALAYHNPADRESVLLQRMIAEDGLDKVLAVECGLLPCSPIGRAVKEQWFALVHREIMFSGSDETRMEARAV